MSIKDHKNWLVWKEKHQPMSALTGQTKGWNRNLCTYSEAAEFCLKNEGYSLGICFSEDLPYVGLDLDSCVVNGEPTQWARDVILTLVDSMIVDNISVSGTGIKLILKCDENVKRGVKFIDAEQYGSHAPQIELFTDNKYFALTNPLVITDKDANNVDLKVLSEVMGYDVTVTAGTVEPEKPSGNTTPEELKDMLSKLDVNDFPDRESWFKLMQGAHHGTGGSDEGREVFKAWSMGDEAQFNEWHFERDWGSIKTDAARPVTIATVIHHLPKTERPKISPEEDFDELPVQEGNLLPWLLNEQSRNHHNVAKQIAQEKEGRICKFVREWKCWIIYMDGVWVRDASGSMFHGVVLDYLEALTARIPNTGGEEAAKAAGWISTLRNYNQTSGIIKQAQGERGLQIQVADIVEDKHLLNFRNGSYDLKNDEFRQHSPLDYCFHQCNTDYVEGAVSQTWERVISDIFAGDDDLIRYVRRVLGLSISGDCSDPVFNIFYGDGCNGKSTVVQCIADLLGTYSSHLPSELLDNRKGLHPTYMAQLHNARLAIFAEMEADTPLAESTVKKLTSQDTIEARRMRENPWYFEPTHTSVICTNHRPTIKGRDKGIWRRLRLVPFTVNLEDKKDVTIPAKLREELAGVANWLIRGYQEAAEHGVGSCDAVEEATEMYRVDEDEFARVADDLFTEKHGTHLPVVDAFQSYVRTGGRLGRKKFCMEMDRIGHEKKKRTVGGSRAYCFENMTLAHKEFGG